MKIKTLVTVSALTFGLITSTFASKNTMNINSENIKKASYIKLLSQPERQTDLQNFLKQGAKLVGQTEPNTALWFALKDKNNFAIFDVFFNEQGREQHFAGQVAHALKENADLLVKGGWENGVLQNVNNSDILASNHFNKNTVLTAKEASYIVLKAKAGKDQELELFLKNAAQVIDKTEPNTYFWVALKINQDTYAIFDAFPNKEAQQQHFSGQVAKELQKNAEQLVAGGWVQGVLANVQHYQIVARS
jgi:quinol monooxygenase YgiN